MNNVNTSEQILTQLESVEASVNIEAAAEALARAENTLDGSEWANAHAFRREREALLEDMRAFKAKMAQRLNKLQSLSGSCYDDMF